jgi:AcrR family transcriptional regulator
MAARSAVLLAMDGDQRYIPRSGAMFSRGSLARAEMATDLAIPILADGGWAALTLRNVAVAANVTPQAIAAWFPSVGDMRTAVAARYGDRWIRERSYLAHRRTPPAGAGATSRALSDLAVALLPQSWLEEVYDGIWLTILEAARWDDAIAATVASVHEREHELVHDLVEQLAAPVADRPASQQVEVRTELVLALVRGMRSAHAPSRQGLTRDRASMAFAGLSAR